MCGIDPEVEVIEVLYLGIGSEWDWLRGDLLRRNYYQKNQ
jgi:hypothetical protein